MGALKEIYPLSSIKYFECFHNRLSYGRIGQYGRSPDSESYYNNYICKANTKSNYDRHIILTGSARVGFVIITRLI
jgi:hypothetical protein